MSSQIKFDRYDFAVSTLTEVGVVTPLDCVVRETEKGGLVTSTECALFGDSRRPYPGQMEIHIDHTDSNGVRWKCNASMQHLVKGVKVKVDPVPGTALVEAGGNPVEIQDGQGYTTVFPSGWYMAPRVPQSGMLHAGANGAQHLFIEGEGSLLMLSSDDCPPRFQRYWAFRQGDQLALTVYLESNVSSRLCEESRPKAHQRL
jgi:hypothetical protein